LFEGSQLTGIQGHVSIKAHHTLRKLKPVRSVVSVKPSAEILPALPGR
jgi:hypothetical protein